jgi:hypothetical protein
MHGSGLFQGYHVRVQLPGTITSVIRESRKPWLVDPETYVFAQAHRRLLDVQKDPPVVRKSIAELVLAYGAPFSDAAGRRSLTPSDFSSEVVARRAVSQVLEYQRAKFRGQLGLFPEPYYDKYSIWDEDDAQDAARPPQRVLVPPYFFVKSLDDPWLAVNVALLRHAIDLRKKGELIYPILLFRSQLLSVPGVVAGIVRRYQAEKADGYLLWPDNFKEELQTPESLKGLSRLVQDLSDSGQRVTKLYGGFFTALLGRNGLRGFSCGLGYGASKSAFAYGGGPPVPRYYIPRLHRAFEFEQARGLLQANSALFCGCNICKDVFGRNLKHFDQMLQRGRSEYHFLTTRDAELRQISEASAKDIATELRASHAAFPGSAAGGEYLESWAGLLS